MKKIQADQNSFIRRFLNHKLGTFSLFLLGILMLAAILAPLLSPYDPNAIVGKFSQAPNGEFLLGTDQVGRDVLSRLLYGSRVSLMVGFLATLISSVIGIVLGLLAGYFGGFLDMMIIF